MALPRVALDFADLDTLTTASGQYRYVVDLVRGLAHEQMEMDFLLLGSLDHPVPELVDIFEGAGARWEYRKVPRRHYRGYSYLRHAEYAWLLRREHVNLLHVLHTFVPFFAPCPVVVTVFDLAYELFDEYKHARISRPYRMYRWAVRRLAKRVICISERTAVDLHHLWGIERERIDPILLGTNFSVAPTEDGAFIRGVVSGGPTLLSPYNLEPRKNLDALLEATAALVQHYPLLKLILFGRAAITPEREVDFERKLSDLNIRHHVMRVGVVTDEHLAALYRYTTMFVFPSLYEGFGLPVLEAMASGACVVANQNSAMAEVVGDDGILLDIGNPEDLATAITQLLENNGLRLTLGRQACERARCFNIGRMSRLTFQTYFTALNTECVE